VLDLFTSTCPQAAAHDRADTRACKPTCWPTNDGTYGGAEKRTGGHA
jgi:hypothetical protein